AAGVFRSRTSTFRRGSRLFVFFFFQAEDGIRDWSVTGVQTCALPISRASAAAAARAGPDKDLMVDVNRGWDLATAIEAARLGLRSEERRVGKECRARWWQYH